MIKPKKDFGEIINHFDNEIYDCKKALKEIVKNPLDIDTQKCNLLVCRLYTFVEVRDYLKDNSYISE